MRRKRAVIVPARVVDPAVRALRDQATVVRAVVHGEEFSREPAAARCPRSADGSGRHRFFGPTCVYCGGGEAK